MADVDEVGVVDDVEAVAGAREGDCVDDLEGVGSRRGWRKRLALL